MRRVVFINLIFFRKFLDQIIIIIIIIIYCC
jgi:hypothetical protein